MSRITIDNNFGAAQLLKDILPQSHMVDIRVRLNGEYYWFEGDFLKEVIKHVTCNQADNDGIKTKLSNHKQLNWADK